MDVPEFIDKEFSSEFSQIQPICVNLARNYSLESLKHLEQALKNVSPKFIHTYQEYLIFPIRISLLKDLNEHLFIQTLEISTYIFNNSSLSSWPLFSSTVHAILLKICDPKKANVVSATSEELKLSACECISSMIQNANEVIRQSMYATSYSLPLAHIIHTLVSILNSERSKSLRRALLRTIGLICYSKEFLPVRNSETEKLASKSMAFYLPGLSIGLGNVVCGDNKQGESVIRLALKVLGDLIALTVDDCCPVDEDQKVSLSNPSQVAVTKNEKWFKEVAEKLIILIQKTTVLVTHDHWRVRQDYLGFAELILLKCTSNLENCVPILLPAVFALSVDNYESISKQGKIFIEKFSKKFNDMNSLTLCSVIEDELYVSASKLIKCKLSASDDQKLFTLKSVLGCLQILGNSVDKILVSVSHLEKLLLSLLNLLEFESSLPMVEEVAVDLDMTTPNIMPRKRFCYFEKQSILDAVCSICCCLGKSKHNRLVIDYLIENMHTSEMFILQSIFLMGCIVEGFPCDNPDEHVDLVGDVIEEVLSPALFDVPLHKVGVKAVTYKEQSSVQVYNDSNIYQVCLILETVGKCAKLLRKSFKVFLMKILFKIMEKAGSSNYIVSQAGKICLYGIARHCDYNPRVELIRENADYLVNSIILNYHNFLYKPEMSAVLQVILQESDGEMLLLFKDCINCLLKMLDNNQDKAIPIMIALKAVVVFVKKWYPTQKLLHETPTSNNEFTDLKSYFIQKSKKKSELSNDNCPIPDSEDFESETIDDDTNLCQEEKKIVPLHASLVAQILKKCSYFQSCNNLQLKVLVLEVMELCILALGDFENELHPLIHQLWDTFVRRFSEDTIIMLPAFRVLLVISAECRDFVRAKCLKDVIPKLTTILEKQISSSVLKNYARSYQWSNDCKLQLLALSEVGNLLVMLDVAEKDVAKLAEVCLPYLQNSQPKVFRDAALRTLKALAGVDPDALWFYFSIYYSETQVISPPHNYLCPITFPKASIQLDPEFKFDC